MIKFEQSYPQSQPFIEAFLDPAETRPKFVFGTNHEAVEIANQVKLAGFVDDLKETALFEGLPVIRSQQIPQNALVVIVALMRPLTIQRKLQAQGVEHLHSITLMRFSHLQLTQPWFWKGFDADFAEHRHFYENFDRVLADAKSVEIFQNLINFRLTGNLACVQNFEDKQAQQYFEPFLDLKAGDSFVDIGGYDGQTALEFVKHCPEYDAIHLFEPEAANMKIAQSVCAPLRDVHFHPYGVSDQAQILGIKSGGSTSQVVAKGQGDYDIEIRRLDEVMQNKKVSFLKMDIEGAEQLALDGAAQLITKQQPKMAICVYHQGNDFRVIYQKVMAFNPNYSVYLRHYTEGIVETVMFFVPK